MNNNTFLGVIFCHDLYAFKRHWTLLVIVKDQSSHQLYLNIENVPYGATTFSFDMK